MPALVYSSSNFPFVPFTKIYSADVNSCFTDIRTLLNTTGLNYTNVQVHGLTRLGASSNLAAGTANYAVFNDSSGDLSEAAYLPTAQGGMNNNVTPASAADAGKTLKVDSTGLKYELSSAPVTTLNVFNYYAFS